MMSIIELQVLWNVRKMAKNTFYALYDENDYLEFVGNANEISKYLGIKKSSLFSRISHQKTNKTHFVKKIYVFQDETVHK